MILINSAEILAPTRKESEAQVLGHVFIFPELTERFCSLLKPENFKDNRQVAQTIQNLYTSGRLVNYMTVGQELNLDRDGYIAMQDFSTEVQHDRDFDKWCALLLEECLRDHAEKVGMHLLKKGDDVLEQITGLEDIVLDYVSRLRTGGYSQDDILRMLLEAQGVITYGMPLDVLVTNTDLVVLAARPGMGKTAFAIKCALNMARLGVPVAFLTREMSAKQIAARVISITSRIHFNRIMQQELWHGEEEQFENALKEFRSLPFHIVESPSSGAGCISKCKEYIANKGVKCIFVDYLQLLEAEGENREKEISWLSRSFKNLAKDTQVPVMLLSQLSRETEKRSDKMPHLSDLRDSGSIEQDADIVIMLYRPEYYSEKGMVEIAGTDYPVQGLAAIGVEKYRNGKCGRRAMRFVGEYMDFVPFD